jgi:phytanoyl-CoA hydroxylase
MASKDDVKRHVKELPERAQKLSFRKDRFLAKRGDALIWSADLAHGGSPISRDRTRKSVVAHYCPAEIVPSYYEHRRAKGRIPYKDGIAYYSTNQYSFDPIGPP